MSLEWIIILIVLLGGAGLPAQTAVNGALSKALGSPLSASVVSFCVGTVALLLLWLALRPPLPSFSTLKSLPWWIWIGGLLGAFYVTIAIIAAPRIGVATLLAVTLVGQMLASLILDHYGIAGLPVHAISPQRVIGILLLITGVMMIRGS